MLLSQQCSHMWPHHSSETPGAVLSCQGCALGSKQKHCMVHCIIIWHITATCCWGEQCESIVRNVYCVICVHVSKCVCKPEYLLSKKWFFIYCSLVVIGHLCLMQNAAARLLTNTRCREHMCPVLPQLHWLSVLFGIQCEILFNIWFHTWKSNV